MGIDKILKIIKQEFQAIGSYSFITIDDNWSNTISAFCRTSRDKAIFVLGGTPERGTLEDILITLIEFTQENHIILSKTKNAINDIFEWNISDPKDEIAIAEKARYKKAVLTTMGQRKKPGYSLNVILEQSNLISVDALTNNILVEEFIKFITGFWLGDIQEPY